MAKAEFKLNTGQILIIARNCTKCDVVSGNCSKISLFGTASNNKMIIITIIIMISELGPAHGFHF